MLYTPTVNRPSYQCPGWLAVNMYLALMHAHVFSVTVLSIRHENFTIVKRQTQEFYYRQAADIRMLLSPSTKQEFYSRQASDIKKNIPPSKRHKFYFRQVNAQGMSLGVGSSIHYHYYTHTTTMQLCYPKTSHRAKYYY